MPSFAVPPNMNSFSIDATEHLELGLGDRRQPLDIIVSSSDSSHNIPIKLLFDRPASTNVDTPLQVSTFAIASPRDRHVTTVLENADRVLDPSPDTDLVTSKKRPYPDDETESHSSSSASTSSSALSSESSSVTSANSVGRRAHFRALGDAVKSSKRFKLYVESIIDDWVECADDPVARELIMLTCVLDILNTVSVGTEEYHTSPALKGSARLPDFNLKKYTVAIICSPVLTTYRGDVVDCVLSAMRECKIAEVPDTRDEAKIDILGREIEQFATEIRYIIKTKVVKSIAKDANVVCITELMDQIIKKAGISLEITTPMLIRLAFLRRVIMDEPLSNAWLAVDREMRAWEAKWPLLEDRRKEYIKTFEADTVLFPMPASGYFSDRIVLDLQGWQACCDRHAARAGID